MLRNMLSARAIGFLFLAVPPSAMVAQPAAESRSAPLRLDTNLVPVTVGVVDDRGRPVTGLTTANFRVFDDKVEQQLLSLTRDDGPLAVGLIFDSSRSMGTGLRHSRIAAKAFFETANPQDEYLLVEFNDRAALSVPLTSDPTRIQDRLMAAEAKGKTALLDAVYLGLTEIRKSKKQRKVLLVLSDGGDNNSRHTQRELAQLVSEAQVPVYVMGIFAPVEFLAPEDTGPRLLTWISEQTGGRHYSVDSWQLAQTARQIGLELRARYVLTFSPANLRHDGGYHSLQVRIVGSRGMPELFPVWRRGYYAPQANVATFKVETPPR